MTVLAIVVICIIVSMIVAFIGHEGKWPTWMVCAISGIICAGIPLWIQDLIG